MSSRRPPARLRRILSPKATTIPPVDPFFVGLSGVAADNGVTTAALHPVVRHVLGEFCLIESDNYGWSVGHALKLAAEQADELRQLGLAHQVEFLWQAIHQDTDLLLLVLADCSVGRPHVAISRVALCPRGHAPLEVPA
jgi:hypothetical protein